MNQEKPVTLSGGEDARFIEIIDPRVNISKPMKKALRKMALTYLGECNVALSNYFWQTLFGPRRAKRLQSEVDRLGVDDSAWDVWRGSGIDHSFQVIMRPWEPELVLSDLPGIPPCPKCESKKTIVLERDMRVFRVACVLCGYGAPRSPLPYLAIWQWGGGKDPDPFGSPPRRPREETP